MTAESPQVVILAGGRGTRIGEETHLRPKPMIEIGGRPILWHIMKHYGHYGLNDFIVCLGYKGQVIKEYFVNYRAHNSDILIDLAKDEITFGPGRVEPWRVTLVDTGEHSLTGGRVKRIAQHLRPNEPFCLTYGDGVGNVDIDGLLAFHRAEGLMATMTVVRPPARYGNAVIGANRVIRFAEKSQADAGHISGGFFVVNPEVIGMIADDETPFEGEPLERLVELGQLAAWEHDGFWQPMDTMRDRDLLEQLWSTDRAPWKVWSE